MLSMLRDRNRVVTCETSHGGVRAVTFPIGLRSHNDISGDGVRAEPMLLHIRGNPDILNVDEGMFDVRPSCTHITPVHSGSTFNFQVESQLHMVVSLLKLVTMEVQQEVRFWVT